MQPYSALKHMITYLHESQQYINIFFPEKMYVTKTWRNIKLRIRCDFIYMFLTYIN